MWAAKSWSSRARPDPGDRSTQSEVAPTNQAYSHRPPVRGTAPVNRTVLNLPELTVSRLVDHTVVRPNGKIDWLLAYHINYLQVPRRTGRLAQWLAAIDNLGPEL